MVRNIENGPALIEKWLRNKNTIEFLGVWEEIYNPDFNSPEFEGIKNAAGLNRFILSVKQWCEKTGPNGNSIFLPVAGCRDGDELVDDGEYGYYWSSTPYGSSTDLAYFLSFDEGHQGVDWDFRDYGLSVRPVLEN